MNVHAEQYENLAQVERIRRKTMKSVSPRKSEKRADLRRKAERSLREGK